MNRRSRGVSPQQHLQHRAPRSVPLARLRAPPRLPPHRLSHALRLRRLHHPARHSLASHLAVIRRQRPLPIELLRHSSSVRRRLRREARRRRVLRPSHRPERVQRLHSLSQRRGRLDEIIPRPSRAPSQLHRGRARRARVPPSRARVVSQIRERSPFAFARRAALERRARGRREIFKHPVVARRVVARRVGRRAM